MKSATRVCGNTCCTLIISASYEHITSIFCNCRNKKMYHIKSGKSCNRGRGVSWRFRWSRFALWVSWWFLYFVIKQLLYVLTITSFIKSNIHILDSYDTRRSCHLPEEMLSSHLSVNNWNNVDEWCLNSNEQISFFYTGMLVHSDNNVWHFTVPLGSQITTLKTRTTPYISLETSFEI